MTAETDTAADPAGEPKTANTCTEISAEGKMLNALYGANAAAKLGSANVLVVGAGGVGCELLKNLAFNGFRSVTVIDLDTIDVSNLNRQFLFRREHVGKSKAVCAAEAIRKMVPGMEIEGIVANIKDPKFNVEYFKSFNVVCNALDNLEARRHVNRVSLAAKVPLIESGSTGYNGQISIHAPGFECYDCIEKKPQKAVAVCTIRSTPEKPVHCIVWAKSLWDLIFGPDDDGNLLADLDANGASDSTGAEAKVEGPTAVEEEIKEVNGKEMSEVPVKKAGKKRVRYAHPEPAKEFADRVCSRIFVDDIEEQAAMKNRWKEKAPPKAYDVVDVAAKSELVDLSKINLLEQRAWDAEESSRVFYAVLHHVVEKRKKEIGKISFDKDDDNALAFVVAAANLRAESYRVPKSSPFAVKGIAGNIVHAIATTNAVVGGLVVQEALKIVMHEGVEKCHPVYFSRRELGSAVKKLVNPTAMLPPKPNCYVCSKGQLLLTIDTTKYTLKNFIEYVLKKKLSVAEPSVYVTSGSFYNVLFECGEGLEEDEIESYEANLEKTLGELKAENGAQLGIEDLKQNLKCDIHVRHEEGCEEDKPISEQFTLSGKKPEVRGENGNNDIISAGVRKTDTTEVEDVDDAGFSITGVVGAIFASEGGEKSCGEKIAMANGNGEAKAVDIDEEEKKVVEDLKETAKEMANSNSMDVDTDTQVKEGDTNGKEEMNGLKRKALESEGEGMEAAKKRLKENGSMY